MASEVLQMDMKKLCFTENEKLNQTEYTQAALVTTCLAMARSAEAKGMKADVTAGLSLGEYCAIAISGGMYDREAVYAVRKRGILMEQAVPGGEGAMAAVLGLSADQVEHVLNEREDVFVANYNCPGQIVITGKKDAVLQAGEALISHGAKRVLPLKVSGPFHSTVFAGGGKSARRNFERDFVERAADPVHHKCNGSSCSGNRKNTGTSCTASRITGPLAAKYGTDDRGGGRYVYRDRSRKYVAGLFEKN